jgi:RND superfamily putative drug exporter
MRWLAAFGVKRRAWVVAMWIAAASIAVPNASRVSKDLAAVARIKGSEASSVEKDYLERFKSPLARTVVAVVTRIPSPRDPVGREALDIIVKEIARTEGVSGTLSTLNSTDTLLAGASEGAVILIGLDPRDPRPDEMIPVLRDAAKRGLAVLRARYPAATISLTGDAAITYDLRLLSGRDARSAEARVLPVTLILLIAAFGAAVAALLPVVSGGMAIVISLGIAVLVNEVWSLSIFVQNAITMMGLALGIDYGLLIVGRFREELDDGKDSIVAAIEAGTRAGSTILLSGTSVLIGFVALVMLPVNELSSLALGGMIAVTVSMLLAMTLMPALLSWLGAGINRGRLWRRSKLKDDSPGWRRWGRFVVSHPLIVLICGTVPLLVLASQGFRINPSLPRGDWLPRNIESARGATDLIAMGRGGAMNSVRILVDLPPGVSLVDSAGWNGVANVTGFIRKDPRIVRVRSITSVVPGPGFLSLGLVPPPVLGSLVSQDWRTANLEAIPADTVDFVDLVSFVRDVRHANAREISHVEGARIRLGGMPAANTDYADAIASRLWRTIFMVLAAAFVALAIGFRSILIPLKAVLLNLLSVGAAFGAVVLVFQDGHGATLLGMHGALHGVFPGVPITVFCIVFGLSLDYEVFLLARVYEARRNTDDKAAIVEGLVRTGRMITSAASIMIVVFGAFALGDVILIKVLGFALAIAVLFDATIARIALGPALLALAGRWNWWPGPMHLDRVVDYEQ